MKISAKLRVVELRRNKQHKMKKQARTAYMWLVPGVPYSHQDSIVASRDDGNISKNRICSERI